MAQSKIYESRTQSTTLLPGTERSKISCRVTNSTLKYVESLGYDVTTLIDGLSVSKEYLANPLNWVPAEVRDILAERAVRLLGDQKVMYRVGLATPKLSPINGVEHMVRFLGNPRLAYKYVPKYASLFDKTTHFETKFSDKGKVIVTLTLIEGCRMSKHACYYAQGILAAIPTVWNLPPAEVSEIQCMFDNIGSAGNDIVEDIGKNCTYEVRWEIPRKKNFSLPEKISHKPIRSYDALKKLEENFRQLDEKNAELTSRNAQLSKVREMALGIDNVKTVEQVLDLVVEGAMGIPGVRLAMICQLDDKSETITIPY